MRKTIPLLSALLAAIIPVLVISKGTAADAPPTMGKVVLNAIAWISGMAVPETGIASATPTDAQ